MNAEVLTRKQQLVKSGDGYYISVDRCTNPEVNEDYYFGPPLFSAGLPDGIQPDSTVSQKPIWGESSRPIERILRRKVIVDYGVTHVSGNWSMFLTPTLCPESAKQAKPREKYIYLSDPLDTSATCSNNVCPFHAEHMQPPLEQRSRLGRFIDKIKMGLLV